MLMLNKDRKRGMLSIIYSSQDLVIMSFGIDVQKMHFLNSVSHEDIGKRIDMNLAFNDERLKRAIQMLHDMVSI